MKCHDYLHKNGIDNPQSKPPRKALKGAITKYNVGTEHGNEYYLLIRDGVSLIFTGSIVGIVIGTIMAIAIIAVIFAMLPQITTTSAPHIIGAILIPAGIISIILAYTFNYRGFTHLTKANRPRYSIGRVGAIIQVIMIAVVIALGVVLMIINMTIEQLTMYIIPIEVVGVIPTILITIALYRLGEEFSMSYLSNGAIIILFGTLLGIIPFIGFVGGIIALIGLILTLVGLNEVKKSVEAKLTK